MPHAIIPPPYPHGPVYGHWDRKYIKNIPGPIYSTTDNFLSLLASNDDRGHLLFDANCEFVWKQPCTADEFRVCYAAINCDEIGSYQTDGNNHWTPELVSQWWHNRASLVEWAYALLNRPSNNATDFWNGKQTAVDRSTIMEYIRYLNEDAEEYLRSYIFLLQAGRAAKTTDQLPPHQR